ncbi:hypothetical protein [Serratia rubidaea]|uniref:hypothetical protein n=1 Tax=Serratia rubidaea TaxID=61652 RepID=UPI00242E3B59|nr:hypothetical protein [Serratia rubidaea]MCR0998678.1 hypothetical protein [Serratia rubidaea]
MKNIVENQDIKTDKAEIEGLRNQLAAVVAERDALAVEKFAAWAGAQESMAAEDGDKKEAAIYRQLEARARHYAAELLEHGQKVERK